MSAPVDAEPVGRTHAERVAKTVVAGISGGIVLGVLDFMAQRVAPYPWAELANSTAVWAAAAFAVGWWLAPGSCRAAAGGVVLLVVAVESYYLAATIVQHDLAANLFSPTTQVWLTFAVLAGALFGWAGAAGHDRRTPMGLVGLALPTAVLCAEALRRVRHVHADGFGVAAVEAALAMVLVLLAARTNRGRALAVLAAIPLTLVGYGAFVVAQIG